MDLVFEILAAWLIERAPAWLMVGCGLFVLGLVPLALFFMWWAEH